MRYAKLLSGWDGRVTEEFNAQLRVLRSMCLDVAELRRGDHSRERVLLERERLGKHQELPEREVLTPEEKEARFAEIFGLVREEGKREEGNVDENEDENEDEDEGGTVAEASGTPAPQAATPMADGAAKGEGGDEASALLSEPGSASPGAAHETEPIKVDQGKSSQENGEGQKGPAGTEGTEGAAKSQAARETVFDNDRGGCFTWAMTSPFGHHDPQPADGSAAKRRRFIVIVLDGVGAGAAPDAEAYGDAGSNSLCHAARAVGGIKAPNLAAIGLGCITDIQGVPARATAGCGYGKMQPQSPGKDTVAGHWELMGIRLAKPFRTYPNGFPPEVIDAFTQGIGREVLGNKPASGTEIIQEFGAEHLRTGKPIVYTSADSVFQVAAHEEVIPVAELHRMCVVARQILRGDHAVGRVIARPFVGPRPGEFRRTGNRRDYPLAPESATVMDKLVEAGKRVVSVGKIDDIFGGRGISESHHTADNRTSTEALLEVVHKDFEGLLFANLIEFDMIHGHRRDPKGYVAALEEFDRHLPEIQRRLRAGDLAMLVADHGVDPTAPGSDHTREYVPLLVFGPDLRGPVNLGVRQCLSDVAATIAEGFGLEPPAWGTSFLRQLS
jgi:phosphopentomutase